MNCEIPSPKPWRRWVYVIMVAVCFRSAAEDCLETINPKTGRELMGIGMAAVAAVASGTKLGLFHFNLISTAIHKRNHHALHAIENHRSALNQGSG